MFGALSDIRVIDLTQMLAGPFGTQMLADHGAEVIKIEPPQGDMTRPAGPFRRDDERKTHAGYFQSVNRNKKSIVLNLKCEEGKLALKRLVEKADVVCENFRPGVMEGLGLGYEALKKINPKIIYACLRGFGDPATGETSYTNWPAFDVVAQAMGGIMGITGPGPGSPTKIGPGVGDLIPGTLMAFGVLAALHERHRSGEGQLVDVAMVDAVLAFCERIVYQYSLNGVVPGPQGNGHPFQCPFGLYPAADGHVALATPQQSFFDTFCVLLDAPELKDDPRFNSFIGRQKNKPELEHLVSDLTAKFTKAELKKRLGGKIPFGPVMQIDEIFADSYFRSREMIVDIEQPGSANPVQVAGVPVKLSRTPGMVNKRGPYQGEHTEALLGALGLSEEQISAASTGPKREL